MKRIYSICCLYIGIFFLFSCEKDASDNNLSSLFGKWKHYQSRTKITSNNGEVVYSDVFFANEKPSIVLLSQASRSESGKETMAAVNIDGTDYDISEQSENNFVLVKNSSYSLFAGKGTKMDYIYLQRISSN